MTPDEALDSIERVYHTPLAAVVRAELERLRARVAELEDSVSFNAYRALEKDLAAARALSPVVRDALDMAHSALTYFQVTAICQADTDTAVEALEAINDALAGKDAT